MNKPAVSWYWDYKDANNNTKQDKVGMPNGTLNLWDLGTVKAGNSATADDTARTFYIWNNKGNTTETYQTMTECKITVRDGDTSDGVYHEGNADSPWVRGEWFEGKLIKNNTTAGGAEVVPTTWSKMGFNTTSLADDLMSVESYAPDSTGTSTAGTGEISGQMNDGSFATNNTKNCYAKLMIRMVVPAEADAGQINFIVRLYYSARVV